MRKTITTLSVVTAFCLSGAFTTAHAQDAAEPAAEAVEEETTDDEIVVSGEIDEGDIERCRIIRVTGTRFRERVCVTRNEMEEQRQNNQEVINDHRYDGPGPVEDHPTQPGPAVPPI